MDMSTASQHDTSSSGGGDASAAARSWYDHHQQRLLENPPAPCLPASEDVETYLPTLEAGGGRGHRYFGAAHSGYAPAHPSDWGCEYRQARDAAAEQSSRGSSQTLTSLRQSYTLRQTLSQEVTAGTGALRCMPRHQTTSQAGTGHTMAIPDILTQVGRSLECVSFRGAAKRHFRISWACPDGPEAPGTREQGRRARWELPWTARLICLDCPLSGPCEYSHRASTPRFPGSVRSETPAPNTVRSA